jgi:Z1 domain
VTNKSASTGTAIVPPDQNRRTFTIEAGGPCLRGTVHALLDDDSDSKMQPEHEASAVSEATRFAEAILSAYVERYGQIADGVRERSTTRQVAFPTGLLYGCVQSGKTRAITLTSAILFDNDIRIVVVLTSNNVELVEQTASRLRTVHDVRFLTSLEDDAWERDEAYIGAHLRETGLLVVCQKERSHQRTLISFLQNINASGLPAVIFDDEADQATPDTTQAARSRNQRNAPQIGSTTYRLIVENDSPTELGESLAETLSHNVFVQVTATPYALLLQHIDHPLRPKFTCLIEPGDDYVGGEWFFPEQLRSDPISRTVIEVPPAEASALAAGAMQIPPEMLRRAIAYFCIAAAVAELRAGRSKYGYSFLCHTSSKKADHTHLVGLIGGFLEQINRDLAAEVAGDVSSAFAQAYADLATTAPQDAADIPYSTIREWILRKLPLRNMRTINAEGDSLSLTPGLNFLVGGNILGRGLTIRRLLVTYYMRNARATQMDTMLQHARMFGYRGKDKDLIRVFLPRTSINRFIDIVLAERNLRGLIKDAHAGAIPVRVAQNLNATRRNILDTGSLDAYHGGQQIYPYDPEYDPEELGNLTERLTALMKDRAFQGDIVMRHLVEIEWSLFEDLIKSVRIRESDDSRWLTSAIINVSHALRKDSEGNDALRPMLWCRDMPRRRGPTLLNGAAGGDDPSITMAECSGRLVLMMFKSPGDVDQNWAGAPFWYPTVLLPTRTGMFLFSASE